MEGGLLQLAVTICYPQYILRSISHFELPIIDTFLIFMIAINMIFLMILVHSEHTICFIVFIYLFRYISIYISNHNEFTKKCLYINPKRNNST